MWEERYAGLRCGKGNIVPLEGALIPQLHWPSYKTTIPECTVSEYSIYSLTLGYFQLVIAMLHFVVEYLHFSKSGTTVHMLTVRTNTKLLDSLMIIIKKQTED